MVRVRVQVDNLEHYEDANSPPPRMEPNGNLVSSYVEGSLLHMPVIDLDFPCELVPSATPGHFHLYVNKAISQDEQQALLDGLLAAGLIEQGWYDGCVRNGYTRVRHPDHPKQRPGGNGVVPGVTEQLSHGQDQPW